MPTPLRFPVRAPAPPAAGRPPVAHRLAYVPALDGLRGVAVLLVSLLHFHVPFLPGGYLGVDLFFVLSGFLITSLLAQEWQAHGAIDLWRFYGRRMLRLMPALWVMLLALAPVLTFEQWVTGLGYTANWVMAAGTPLGHLNHVWSLAIEEQFYLAWPLLFVVLMRSGLSRRTVLGITCAAALAVTVNRLLLSAGGAPWQRLYYGTDIRVDGLLLGAAAGLAWAWDLAQRIPAKVVTVSAWAGGAALAGLAVTLPVESPLLYRVGLTVASAGAVAVVLHLVTGHGNRLQQCLQSRPLVALGRISYGVYLWHHPVAFAAAEWGVPWWLGATVGLPLGIALAAVSYRVVERPALRLKDRLRPKHPPVASAEALAG